MLNMTNLFLRVTDNEDISNFTSQGLDVYANTTTTNLNIFGNHVYPNGKFAVSEIDSNLERYLQKGFAKLLANGQVNIVNNAEIQAAPKEKKKKSSENETTSQEVEVIEETPVVEEVPQSQEPESSDLQEVVATTQESSENTEI